MPKNTVNFSWIVLNCFFLNKPTKITVFFKQTLTLSTLSFTTNINANLYFLPHYLLLVLMTTHSIFERIFFTVGFNRQRRRCYESLNCPWAVAVSWRSCPHVVMQSSRMVPQMGGAVWRAAHMRASGRIAERLPMLRSFNRKTELEKNDTTANRSSVQS